MNYLPLIPREFQNFNKRVKPIKNGVWEIEEIIVSNEDADIFNLKQTLNGTYSRSIRPGTYLRLMKGEELIMSNTPAEIRDHTDFVDIAKGKILLNGLGLGVVLHALLNKSEVKHITIIEISQSLINLISPFFTEKRITFINHNALTYKVPKGNYYDFVWNDIWDCFSTDNISSMSILHRKYGRKCNYQDSWGRHQVKRMQRDKNIQVIGK